jgi:RND family efflux transporter MFP subunit
MNSNVFIMRRNKLYSLVIALVIFHFISCSGDKEKAQPDNAQRILVAVSTPLSNEQKSVLASGQVESAQTANISTRVMGTITNLYVKAGEVVRKGQVLATISDEDIKAKRSQTNALIAEVEASFASAKKDYDRFNNLYKQQSATAKELDNVTLQYNSAIARLTAARQMKNEINAMLSYSTLTAPFSGVVTQKLAEVGSISNPGMPILTIEQNGILQVSATVAESDINNLRLNDVATVIVKSSGKTFKGKVTQINPSSQFTGGQYIIKISIPETEKAGLYSGMFVSVDIPLKTGDAVSSDVVTIPSSALVNRDELIGIYTVSNANTALLRWIRAGKKYGDNVEVLSGLSKDEKFILSSESKLYNGAPVKTN